MVIVKALDVVDLMLERLPSHLTYTFLVIELLVDEPKVSIRNYQLRTFQQAKDIFKEIRLDPEYVQLIHGLLKRLVIANVLTSDKEIMTLSRNLGRTIIGGNGTTYSPLDETISGGSSQARIPLLSGMTQYVELALKIRHARATIPRLTDEIQAYEKKVRELIAEIRAIVYADYDLFDRSFSDKWIAYLKAKAEKSELLFKIERIKLQRASVEPLVQLLVRIQEDLPNISKEIDCRDLYTKMKQNESILAEMNKNFAEQIKARSHQFAKIYEHLKNLTTMLESSISIAGLSQVMTALNNQVEETIDQLERFKNNFGTVDDSPEGITEMEEQRQMNQFHLMRLAEEKQELEARPLQAVTQQRPYKKMDDDTLINEMAQLKLDISNLQDGASYDLVSIAKLQSKFETMRRELHDLGGGLPALELRHSETINATSKMYRTMTVLLIHQQLNYMDDMLRLLGVEANPTLVLSPDLVEYVERERRQHGNNLQLEPFIEQFEAFNWNITGSGPKPPIELARMIYLLAMIKSFALPFVVIESPGSLASQPFFEGFNRLLNHLGRSTQIICVATAASSLTADYDQFVSRTN